MNLAKLIKIPLQDLDGVVRTHYLPTYQDFLVVKPLIELIGMQWEKQTAKLKSLDYITQQQISLPCSVNSAKWLQSRLYICAPTNKVPDLLSKLRPAKPESKHRLEQLVKLLPALLQYYEPEPEPEDSTPELETEVIRDDRSLDEIYAELFPIEIHKPLERLDYIRRELVAVGLRSAEEINYICKGAAITILNHKSDGQHRRSYIHVSSFERGDLLKAARAGFYVIPEFFRRHPSEYRQLKNWVVQVEHEDSRIKTSSIVAAKAVAAPLGFAPWNTDKFADEMTVLRRISETVKTRQEQSRLKELVLRGQSLGDIWGVQDYDQEFVA